MELTAPSWCMHGRMSGAFLRDDMTFDSPGRMVMHDMIRSQNGRARILAQPGDPSELFHRLDEAQFYKAACDAAHHAYSLIIEEHPDVREILVDTGSSPIYYIGSGFRRLILDMTHQDGYGFNIIGKTLQSLRDHGRTRRSLYLTGSILTAMMAMWGLLKTARDDLMGMLGRSVFEIMASLGIKNDKSMAESIGRSFRAHIAISSLSPMTWDDISNVIDMEIAHPGNLAGFLRKHGITLYLDACHTIVARTLLMIVGAKIVQKKEGCSAEEAARIASASIPPDALTTVPRHTVDKLMRMYAEGKLFVRSPPRSLIDMFPKLMESENIRRDAVAFVPRVYVLQQLAGALNPVFVFDYLDKDDPVDSLSPAYTWDLNINGRLFPTVLHYIYFKALALYYPEDDALYHTAMFPAPDNNRMIPSNELSERFNDLISRRRRSHYYEAVALRLRDNPALVPIAMGPDQNDEVGAMISATSDTLFPLLHALVNHFGNFLEPEQISRMIVVWSRVWAAYTAWFSSFGEPPDMDLWFSVLFPDIHTIRTKVKGLSDTTPLFDLLNGSSTIRAPINAALLAHASSYARCLRITSSGVDSWVVPGCDIHASSSSTVQYPTHIIDSIVRLYEGMGDRWQDTMIIHALDVITGKNVRSQLFPRVRTVVINMNTDPKKKDKLVKIKTPLRFSPGFPRDVLPTILPDPVAVQLSQMLWAYGIRSNGS